MKVLEGIIKFYIVYMIFGTMALIVLYGSADLKYLLLTGESFFQTLIHASEDMAEAEAMRAVLSFLRIAWESVPGETFFEAVLGISFESNVGADITALLLNLLQGDKTVALIANNLQNYKLFWRDMAVATSASMVLYAVAHLKTKLVGKDISVWLGFAMASIFWIFAGYTFAETITCALELRVSYDNLKILYIIITVTAILLEASIHAYGGKCCPLRLIALLCLKIFFNLLRSAFVLYMCKAFASFFFIGSAGDFVNIPLNLFGITVSAGIVLYTILIEAEVSKWAEKVL